jgi:hypothetical protein
MNDVAPEQKWINDGPECTAESDAHTTSSAVAIQAMEAHVTSLCNEIDGLISGLNDTKSKLLAGLALKRAYITEETKLWRDAAGASARVKEFLANWPKGETK